jgi:N-acetylglucosamine kinase-like BadF-type ATPase
MKTPRARSSQPLFLGIEGGGTRTTACMANLQGEEIALIEAPPAQLQLITDPQLRALFRKLRARLPIPSSIAIGLAGARSESDFARIRRAADSVWPGVPCHANQ